MNSTATSEPFDASTTPSFKAVEHWANVTPDRTALIYTDKSWKVEQGELINKSVDPSEWKRINYRDFYDRVCRFRDALYHVGVPKATDGGYRVIVLFLPESRVNHMVMIIGLQAAGCVPLFARPKAFGGYRPWARTMLSLKADALLCTPKLRFLFRAIAATTKTPKRETALKFLNAPAIMLAMEKESKTPVVQVPVPNSILDLPTVHMFSGGTTGPPTPIIINHRMLCFQAAAYANLLRERFGEHVIGTQEHEVSSSSSTARNVGPETAISRDGPWTSTHIFDNFVMLDLFLGGTAVLQPMGLSSPAETVCPVTLQTIMQHFQANVTSGPPALWTRMHETCPKGSLQCIQVAVVGGAETSTSFCRESCALMAAAPVQNEDPSEYNRRLRECGFLRIYATTQVLPVAVATAEMILSAEEQHSVCAMGGGVCLGPAADGLDISIDKVAWEGKGGKSQLELSNFGTVEVGEIIVRGKEISPSVPVAPLSTSDVPTRLFQTGDVGYIDPKTGNIFFLGRMAQAVDCGGALKRVPAAGIEALILDSKAVPRCAFVGPKRHGAVVPVVVVQLHDKSMTIAGVKEKLRAALEKSAWSEILSAGIQFAVYPKIWPVDERHSSKVNRFLLRDWAEKLGSGKLHEI